MPLSITVQPNELFPANEAVTLAKLRSAAKPSVAISGSVGSDDLAANSVAGTNIAAASITADKMGLAAITGDAANDTRKGVILVSGKTSTEQQYGELYAGKVNQFLIGAGTVAEGVWTNTYDLESKALSAASSVEVTAQGTSDFALTIKDDAVVKAMMANDSVGNNELSNYGVTFTKFAPGGGIAADGGIAESTNDFWGGVIDIDPAVVVNGYKGKVSPIQPTGKNQVIYADAEGARLKFGAHPCMPKAFIYAHQISGDTSTSSGDATVASDYAIYMSSGVEQITRTGDSGILDHEFRISAGIYATGDTVKCMGWGYHNQANIYMAVTGIHDPAGSGVSDDVHASNNGTIDANRDVKVTFYQDHASNDATATGSYPRTPRNPSVIQLWFY